MAELPRRHLHWYAALSCALVQGCVTPPPEPPPTERRGKDNAEMVYIPAGTFTMGDTHGGGGLDEKPTHPVTLNAFWLDRTEVTNVQFDRFVTASGHRTTAERKGWAYVFRDGKWHMVTGAAWRSPGGPGSPPPPTHPVVQVSWEDATAYCKWADKRLPTEAEWEYAARGTDGWKYPWGNTWEASRARFGGNRGSETTAPVGSYPTGASPFGVLDLAGNVWEWTSSLYKPYPYVAADGREDLTASGDRVFRGGSWYSSAFWIRSASRYRRNPDVMANSRGFRCAQDSL